MSSIPRTSSAVSNGSPEAASEPALVLVYRHEASPLHAESAHWKRVSEIVPGVELVLTTREANYRDLLDTREFQAVVFDWPAEALVEHMLLPELRLRNNTPGIIVVAEPGDSVTVATLYNSGCHRFVPKLAGWENELTQALRGVLRAKRAESAHERTRARLTEMLALLEEKNRRLDEFSITLAHDVRGPLAGISMKLDYVLDTFGRELPYRAKSFLEKAFESTKRLTNLVQAMYEYARLGAKANQFSKVDLTSLVNDTVSDLHVDERVEVKIGVGELPVVWGNAELLRRVFLNLIQNAIKYADKPEVVVNVSCEKIEERALAKFADIVVEDNGPGIPLDAQQTLFSMFTRVARNQQASSGVPGKACNETSARDEVDGLGAGLAVVQRVMELHFGKVRVESAIGRGSRFILSLPLGPVEVG